ncbi:MAG: c-type cytochrome biogenesis protein CcsB [Deltaproteobacteria bacterium]|nr:MAG: c-type cytochrome biogenesis protein CcsB [Deltaproteobacteria bacterium]
MNGEINEIILMTAMASAALSCFAYLFFFIGQNHGVCRAARMLLITSGVLQTLYIAGRYMQYGYVPITSYHEAAFFFAWSTTWAYLSFRLRYSVKNFGTFVSILILILLGISASLPKEALTLRPLLQSIWLPIHAGTAFLSYGFLALAFIGALMYLLQERELKTKRFGYFYPRLPSLNALDQLNSHCLSVGFVFLTVGMVTGILWAKQALGVYWRWDPKETWTVITWFIYLIQVHKRFTVGWQGKRAAVMAVFGFAAVIFTFWGAGILLGGEHSYGR